MTTPTVTAHQLTLFETPAAFAVTTPPPHRAPRRTSVQAAQAQAVHEALAPWVDVQDLKRLATTGGDIRQALRGTPPAVVQHLFALYAMLLAEPDGRYQIKSPTDAATLLMLDMSPLDQEELRVICLDTKNRVQTIDTVYKGSVNSCLIRMSEVFSEACKRKSPAMMVCHNHPSGDPTPSPEDVLVTRQIIEAGALLDVDVLDHLVIGHGRYVSMRERGLGFTK